ncbi:MAG: 5-formyltetrahydrofolate cyclo-ligase [Myxococcota bacterium]
MMGPAHPDASPEPGSGDLRARKAALREAFTKRRRGLSAALRVAASKAVCERLVSLPELAGARSVVLYAPRKGAGEIDLREAFEALRRAGVKLRLPRCVSDERLEFVEVAAWEDLRPGRYGIPEPEGPADEGLSGADRVVLPGVAFDHAGGRLGSGRGYFDRSLPGEAQTAPLLIGVGYWWQRVGHRLPVEPHDRRMDLLVTDHEVFRFSAPKNGGIL